MKTDWFLTIVSGMIFGSVFAHVYMTGVQLDRIEEAIAKLPQQPCEQSIMAIEDPCWKMCPNPNKPDECFEMCPGAKRWIEAPIEIPPIKFDGIDRNTGLVQPPPEELMLIPYGIEVPEFTGRDCKIEGTKIVCPGDN